MYGIIHKEIFDSTVMAEGYEVVYVFMSMISLADDQDCVKLTPSTLARRINMPLENVEHALERLNRQDQESESKDFDGRRIIPISELFPDKGRGWFIVNREKYIDKAKKERRRNYMRDLMRDKRKNANKSQQNANKTGDVSPKLAHIDIDIDINKNNYVGQADEILSFLNEKTGKNFQLKTPAGKLTANAQKIIDRLKDGYTVQDSKMVIARKYREWIEKDDMRNYLTPDTLFRKSKFDKYIGECA